MNFCKSFLFMKSLFRDFNALFFSWLYLLVAQHFTEKFYEKVNKLVLIGSVYKRSDKQIQKFCIYLEKAFATKISLSTRTPSK